MLFAPFMALAQSSPPDGTPSPFKLHPEFELERVAKEPVVLDPVEMKFDKNGTAYVVEMGGYPIAPEDPKDYPGKIVVIKDTNANGKFDQRTVFAEGFRYATSILPYHGGLLVASPPHLLFVKDTNGDSKADLREKLLTGFNVGNSQHNFNGLTYGLDNWIYAATGGNSGTIHWTDKPSKKMDIAGRDFRFRVEERRVEFVGGTTSGFGIAIDAWGRQFTTHNMRHIYHRVLPERYLRRNPHLHRSTKVEIADHTTNGMSRIYAIGEPPTRVNHPEQSGYFSGACGITYYGGGAFPKGFNGNILVGDVVLNLVHRDVIEPKGPSFTARRGRKKVEFFASRDRWLRPVNMTVGPDGALYLIDFHRKVIEHPEWIPDRLEKEMDLTAGKAQGRIYRITPRGGLPHVTPQFAPRNLSEVVKHLEHRNQWWRNTAQRLLVEWNRPASVPLLERLVLSSNNPHARVHAIRTLEGINAKSKEGLVGSLRQPILLAALGDPHPGVRENALILAERKLDEAAAVYRKTLDLANDSHPRVRFQAALSLGNLNRPELYERAPQVQQALLTVLRHGLSSRWTRLAVLTGLGERPLPMLKAFLQHESSSDSSAADLVDQPGSADFLRALAKIVGSRQAGPEMAKAVKALREASALPESVETSFIQGLAQGIDQSAGGSLADKHRDRIAELIKPLAQSADPIRLATVWRFADAVGIDLPAQSGEQLAQAKRIASEPSQPTAKRARYLKLLKFADFSERQGLLFDLLDYENPRSLQQAALQQLRQARDPDIVKRLIEIWPRLTPPIRSQASDLLIYRPENHHRLLSALESGKLTLGQLNLDLERRRRLLRSDDPNIRKRANAFFSDAGVVTRRKAIESMRPALSLDGDAASGKTLFKQACASCHTIQGIGESVGPDLTDIARKSPETLLHDILDPNAAVDPQFIAYIVATENGNFWKGIMAGQDKQSVLLRMTGGKTKRFPRDQIAELSSNGLSLMPEGLESSFSHQEMADLLAFLQQRKK